MNTSRNEFEAFFTKRWPEFEHDKSSAFEIWQAAQASVVVELPEYQWAKTDTSGDYLRAVIPVPEIKAAIKASGARVKQ